MLQLQWLPSNTVLIIPKLYGAQYEHLKQVLKDREEKRKASIWENLPSWRYFKVYRGEHISRIRLQHNKRLQILRGEMAKQS